MTHKIKTGILKKLLDTIREKTMVEKNVSPDCWRRGLRPWIWWSACFDLLAIAKRPWRLKFWQGEASDDSNSNQRDIPACSIWPDCSMWPNRQSATASTIELHRAVHAIIPSRRWQIRFHRRHRFQALRESILSHPLESPRRSRSSLDLDRRALFFGPLFVKRQTKKNTSTP